MSYLPRCEAFAAKGCVVYATARRLESMEGFSSSNIRPLVMDVVDDSSVHGAVEHVVEEAGRIDIVVANAGVPCHGGYPDDNTPSIHSHFKPQVLYWIFRLNKQKMRWILMC